MLHEPPKEQLYNWFDFTPNASTPGRQAKTVLFYIAQNRGSHLLLNLTAPCVLLIIPMP